MQEGCFGAEAQHLLNWGPERVGEHEVLFLRIRMCPGSSTGPQITEAEMADHSGKAFGSRLLLRSQTGICLRIYGG